ncbi:MAG: nucleotidyl transferase AbiEii/AbiGii toxin family protein [Methanomassiliicoccaceae archaeon]|nr:nucleotidyl transferase AbiEii/AbiGii toxin family protein [Methanomassiliicoccaceae archaeon]
MFLHNDKENFTDLVETVAASTGIRPALIEKDYYVTLFLKALAAKEPLLIFKGGTCLSKCFKLVERFSEDIDINLEDAGSLTRKRRKMLKQNIVDTVNELDLELTNPEETRSGKEYNLYEISYPVLFESTALKQHLEVETYFLIDSFPNMKMPVSSLIYDHLNERRLDNIITEQGLEPFDILVQSLERTFVDKIFAICDYYIDNRTDTQSRHLYDLYKILPHMTLDNKMKDFVEEIRKVREGKRDCPSAEKGFSLSDILEKIMAERIYKNDYDTVTSLLLYETVTYDDTMASLQKITDWLKQ